MSISLIAVFIPILMMGGIVGRLFREFAVVLSVAIAMSMVVSLTATPMMCARLLKEEHGHGWLYNPTEKILPVDHLHLCVGARSRAGPSRLRLLLVMLLTIGISVYLYVKIPKGFFPQQDTGRLNGERRGPAAHLLSVAGREGEMV